MVVPTFIHEKQSICRDVQWTSAYTLYRQTDFFDRLKAQLLPVKEAAEPFCFYKMKQISPLQPSFITRWRVS